MFGYATDETEECMPLTLVLSHKLSARLHALRRDGTLPWVRPDSKSQVRISFFLRFLVDNHPFSQVTIEYKFNQGSCVPVRIHTVVISTQHSAEIGLDRLRSEILEKVGIFDFLQ